MYQKTFNSPTSKFKAENIEASIALDTEVRGQISEAIERVLNETSILDAVAWAIEANEIPKAQQENFALGYILGATAKTTSNILVQHKAEVKTRDAKHRKIAEDYGEEEAAANDLEQEQIRKAVRAKADKKVKPLEIDTNAEEVEKIRDMIIPYLTQFRSKISQELALKRSGKLK
jgi:hypothetical protein